jgi:tRNA G26 N,N-dimethylase Trm1
VSIQTSRNNADPNRAAITREVCDDCGYIISERPANPGEFVGGVKCVYTRCAKCAVAHRAEGAAHAKQLKDQEVLNRNTELLSKLKQINKERKP